MVARYSIIIPHRNSISTLKRLLNSIPDDDDFQVIVVDDNSGKEITSSFPYIKRNNTIFVLLDECKGAGYARTNGLKYAKGDWILFADADDYYLPGLKTILDNTINNHNDTDIIIYNIDCINNESIQGKRYYNYVSQFDNSENSWIDVKYRTWTPWAKVFRRSYIEKNQFYFEPRKKGNDCFFVLNAMSKTKKIIVDKTEIYHLSYSPNSLSHSNTRNWNYMFDVYDLWIWRYNFYKKNRIFLWKEYNIFYLLKEIRCKFGFYKALYFFFYTLKKYNYIHFLIAKIQK